MGICQAQFTSKAQPVRAYPVTSCRTNTFTWLSPLICMSLGLFCSLACVWIACHAVSSIHLPN